MAASGCWKRNANVAPPPAPPQPPALGDELRTPVTIASPPGSARFHLPPLDVVRPLEDQPPRPWECESNKDETLIEAGHRLRKADNPGEAVTCYEEALARNQAVDTQEVRYFLAQSYALAGLVVNAQREFERVASGDGEHARDARVILAMLNRLNQRNREEIRRLENALKKLIDATGRPPR